MSAYGTRPLHSRHFTICIGSSPSIDSISESTDHVSSSKYVDLAVAVILTKFAPTGCGLASRVSEKKKKNEILAKTQTTQKQQQLLSTDVTHDTSLQY